MTVAIKADAQKTYDAISAAEVQIRDALQGVLGAKTVEELSDIGRREVLKIELQGAIATIVRTGKIEQLFLPQYVLQ